MGDQHFRCVVLAAGRSSRFGSSKALAQLANGKAMLEQVIASYGSVFSQVDVVASDEIQQQVSAWGGHFIHSPQRELGMSQSLIAGVEANRSASAVLIALGDMPYVTTQTIEAILAASSSSTITVPDYLGQRGNPVVIGRDFYDELCGLKGDIGARALFKSHLQQLVYVSVNDLGVIHDVDTPQQILPYDP